MRFFEIYGIFCERYEGHKELYFHVTIIFHIEIKALTFFRFTYTYGVDFFQKRFIFKKRIFPRPAQIFFVANKMKPTKNILCRFSIFTFSFRILRDLTKGTAMMMRLDNFPH